MNTNFLKIFLTHHAERAYRGLITNAIKHCHAKNMWSVMLHDEPGNRIRMFYADDTHVMHTNMSYDENMALGIHEHHCDVTLVPIFGHVHNVKFYKRWPHGMYEPHKSVNFKALKFESAILNSTPSITEVGEQKLYTAMETHCMLGAEAMYSNQLHTIYIPRWTRAAWLVIEGREEADYDNTMYSNNDKFDFSAHYSKDYTNSDIKFLLEDCVKRL